MTPKYVIFDFNGTMLYDTPKQEEAWREYLRRLIGREISDDEFKHFLHGRVNHDILEHFLGRTLTDAESNELGAQKEEVYKQLWERDAKNFHLAPGLPEFLNLLRAREIPFTIATSAESYMFDWFYEGLSLGRWLERDVVVCGGGSMRGKPAPDIYLKAARRLKADIASTLVFEDLEAGIVSARAAGAGRIVAVASSVEREYFEKMNVFDVIYDFRGAEKYLK